MTAAQQWGAALDAAIRRRDVSLSALARTADVSVMSVSRWRRGMVLPTYDLGLAVAVALDDPALGDLMRTLRTRTCEACGIEFVVTVRPEARWCSTDSCRNVRYADTYRRNNLRRQRRRTRRYGRTLQTVLKMVGDTCRHICGGPFCPDGECPPQVAGYSPFPVAGREEQLTAVPKGDNLSAAARRREAAKRMGAVA